MTERGATQKQIVADGHDGLLHRQIYCTLKNLLGACRCEIPPHVSAGLGRRDGGAEV